MFDRLFGEGQEQQFKRLKIMVLVSSVLILGLVIYYGLISPGSSWIPLLLIIGFAWGIRYVPKFVFHRSIGNLFAENIFAGIFSMFGMLILSCIFGVAIMIIGFFRFIYLLIIRSMSRKESRKYQNNTYPSNLSRAKENNAKEDNKMKQTFKDVNYHKCTSGESSCIICEHYYRGICKIVNAEIPDSSYTCSKYADKVAIVNLVNMIIEQNNHKNLD